MHDFDPEVCFVRTSSRTSLVPREPDEYMVWSKSILRAYQGEAEVTKTLASAEWCTICLSAALEDEEDIFDVVDAHSWDLVHALGSIYDFPTGNFRTDHLSFSLWGDVLYFQSVTVRRGLPARHIANELIDHVIRFYGGRAAAAVFAFGEGDAEYCRLAFEDRGFKVVEREGNVVHLALDLGARRPPLPALPVDTKKVRPLRVKAAKS